MWPRSSSATGPASAAESGITPESGDSAAAFDVPAVTPERREVAGVDGAFGGSTAIAGVVPASGTRAGGFGGTGTFPVTGCGSAAGIGEAGGVGSTVVATGVVMVDGTGVATGVVVVGGTDVATAGPTGAVVVDGTGVATGAVVVDGADGANGMACRVIGTSDSAGEIVDATAGAGVSTCGTLDSPTAARGGVGTSLWRVAGQVSRGAGDSALAVRGDDGTNVAVSRWAVTAGTTGTGAAGNAAGGAGWSAAASTGAGTSL